ncbi:MAG TPA: TerC/Alx family metal homeostasis membrane protein [Ruminiclostridium sp.]|nr:TerC/Alx family metal homeostasis membrane protein [Ruminiclostridium sp.]
MSTKKALRWVVFWIGVSLLFNFVIYLFMGGQKALEFLGGYVIEQSLSLDNLFLFVMVFASCGIKSVYQRRVLNYGIIGAIILRLAFVLLGITVIGMLHWILYIFGGLLIFSGIKMLVKKEENYSFEDSKILKLLKKVIPVTESMHGEKFFVKMDSRWFATPLFAILIVIEGTDIMFAIDSIPAVFAVSTDPFIVFTSNLFAILGLRSMYFLIGNLHEKFWMVKYGVAAVLVFTGLKLALLFFHVDISIGVSLAVIGAVIGGSVLLSTLIRNPEERKELPESCNEEAIREESLDS